MPGGAPSSAGFLILAECQLLCSNPDSPERRERVQWLCMADRKDPDCGLGDAGAAFSRLITFPPLVGFSINKFQPTLTMVKYLPAWHLVGDSQPLGMLQTGPLQAKSLP